MRDEQKLEGASILVEKQLDSNGMPDTLDIGIYYYIDDDGKKVYDIECMMEEFEYKLKELKEK